MQKIDYRIWIALVIYVLVVAASLTGKLQLFSIILTPFVAVYVLGIIFLLVGKLKQGSLLCIIGSAGFIPIGIIGIMGARSMSNKEKQTNFYSNLNTEKDGRD